MKEFPRRPIEPLSPPRGSFDAVLGRARYRRHRRASAVLGVASVFLAGIAGGMSLDGGVSSVRQTIIGFATADDAVPATRPPVTSAAVTPDVDATARTLDATTAEDPAVAAGPPAPRRVTGVAVDVAGEPIAGLYVYPGRPGPRRFLATREPAARTATDGSFSLPCPGTPVLLSPWRVNVPEGQREGPAVWAATFVGGGTEAASASVAPCRSDGRVVETTVLAGSTLEGTVTLPAECADAKLPLWLWLHNDRSLTVRLRDLGAGDSFTLGGLPPGQHTLSANGDTTLVTVGGGATFTNDVTFGCLPGTPTPAPSPTGPTPPPLPSETPTPTSPAGTPSGPGPPVPDPTTTGAPQP